MLLTTHQSLQRAYSDGDLRSAHHPDFLARRKHPTYTVQSAQDADQMFYVRPLREAVQPLSAHEHQLVAHLEVPRERAILVNLFSLKPPRYLAVARDPEQLSSIQA